ncbi:hypothetical protein [Caballeronia pedi]|nr:hypothetical protein [Caballeronia pedi]
MNRFNNHSIPDRRSPGEAAARVGQVFNLLLADAMTDIDVVARELHLGDEMRDRLQRSNDRLICAQSIVEVLVRGLISGASRDGVRDEVDPMESVMAAMETLALEWPTDYGADAVEWLVLGERRY